MNKTENNITDSILDLLEGMLNRILRLDPETGARLGELDGCLLAVELQGLEFTLYLRITIEGLRLSSRSSEVPHATLRGTPLRLLQMVLADEARGFPEGVEIAGDVETARRIQVLLAELDIDWEEQLARLIGDVPAHQGAVALRALARACREARARLEEDAVDYLREEQPVLPYRDEVEDFLAAVDTLRDDTERLALRVERLARRLGELAQEKGA